SVAYLESCPSTSWTLRNLGRKLPAFLKANPKLTAPYAALAYDMGLVEWARVVAFDGPEHKPINPQRMAGVDPARLRLRIQPYITLLQLKYPIDKALGRFKKRSENAVASNAVSGGQEGRGMRIRVQP